MRNTESGASLVVLWLGLHTPSAKGPGSIPGQGTRSHMLQRRLRMPQPKIPCVCVKLLQLCPVLCSPWTLACQAPPRPWNSPGKNTGVGCHALPGDLPNPGIEPGYPALQADSLLSEPPGNPMKGIRGPEMDGGRAGILASSISLSSGAHAGQGRWADPLPLAFFFLFFFFLAISHGTQDLSFPTRNLNPHPYIGSMESKLLDHQGSPRVFFFSLSALDSVSLFLFPSVSAFGSHSMSGCLSHSLSHCPGNT